MGDNQGEWSGELTPAAYARLAQMRAEVTAYINTPGHADDIDWALALAVLADHIHDRNTHDEDAPHVVRHVDKLSSYDVAAIAGIAGAAYLALRAPMAQVAMMLAERGAPIPAALITRCMMGDAMGNADEAIFWRLVDTLTMDERGQLVCSTVAPLQAMRFREDEVAHLRRTSDVDSQP